MNTISDQVKQLKIVIGKAKYDKSPEDSPTFFSELMEPQTPSLLIQIFASQPVLSCLEGCEIIGTSQAKALFQYPQRMLDPGSPVLTCSSPIVQKYKNQNPHQHFFAKFTKLQQKHWEQQNLYNKRSHRSTRAKSPTPLSFIDYSIIPVRGILKERSIITIKSRSYSPNIRRVSFVTAQAGKLKVVDKRLFKY